MAEADPVHAHSSGTITERLDRQRLERVGRLAVAPAGQICQQLEQLDREWDVERRLQANAATVSLVAVILAARSRRWLILAGVVPAFLPQHAVQGWCPALEIFRRLGARTRGEIDAERIALKALRRDFEDSTGDSADPLAAATQPSC